jgi:hypothetical protein
MSVEGEPPLGAGNVDLGGLGAQAGQARPMRAPIPAREIVASAFALYLRYPLLFLVLALGVVLPYYTLVLIATGVGPIGKGGGLGLSYLPVALLVSPLISALHVHAVAEVRAGRTPRLGEIAARGLRVLPTAAATAMMMTLGVILGLILLIVPGVILGFRWYVAVQAAAIEDRGWLGALKRSRELTRGVYAHIFWLGVLVTVITQIPTTIGTSVVSGHETLAAAFIAGVLVQAFVLAFAALATALLYFDLADRQAAPTVTEL